VIDWLEAEGVSVRVPGAGGGEAKLVELSPSKTPASAAAVRPRRRARRATRNRPPGPDRGFDVSHAQGTAVVGSDVCFVVDGSAETSDYRRKKLTDRNDDYANMRELVRWRAERAVAGDDRPDPDLLLIDGGGGGGGGRSRRARGDRLGRSVVVALAKAEELVVTPTGTRRWPDDDPRTAPAPARSRRGAPLRRLLPPDRPRRGQDGPRRRARRRPPDPPPAPAPVRIGRERARCLPRRPHRRRRRRRRDRRHAPRTLISE